MARKIDRDALKKNPLEELGRMLLTKPRIKRGKFERVVSLRDAFNLMVANPNGLKITDAFRKHSGFSERVLTEARSQLIAYAPGLYADSIGGWPPTNHTHLIDENMPRSIAPHIWKNFGRCTHTAYEDLNREPDKTVWQWAVNNSISAILTRDIAMKCQEGDLGLIAVTQTYEVLTKAMKYKRSIDPNALPLVIQIRGDAQELPGILEKHRDFIINALNKRQTPYIRLSADERQMGPSYEKMARMDWDALHKKVIPERINQRKTSPFFLPSEYPAP